MDAAVGDEDRAGNTVGRHIGERRIECAEQPRAVSLAIRLARLDHPRLNAGNALEPLGDRGTRSLGLEGAVAEVLARAFVDHHDSDRGQGIAVLTRQRRISESQHHQRQRCDPDKDAAAARKHQQGRHDGCDHGGGPDECDRNERREADTEYHYRVPTLGFLLAEQCSPD